MGSSFFGVLQRVGRSFMLPIALLPVAGLLLGIGSSFTNHTMLEAYRLTNVIYEGSMVYTVLDIMNQSGNVVFANLALLFAMGVAIGMAKQEKDVAALSGAIAYLVMNTAIYAMITANGGVEAMPPNTTGESLGITTLQMGVFGGIIVGLGVGYLHNRFYKTQLPQVLSFFSGTRFVPIISTVVFLAVGILMFYVWPIVQSGIGLLGNLVIHSGYIGTWIYGIVERALIPFGLHHVFYIPFWQTAVGGTAIIDGNIVQGAQNIFFAELASKETTQFSVEATRFMSGKFPLMIFGLPGAALAIYRAARPEKRKVVGGLLISAALTAMLTGITEPLEFTFLFVAPFLYAVHCVFAGLAYMLMHIFGVGVGMTFSGGLIDLTLFGILQGMEKTNWQWVVIVGIGYFVLYYFTFYFMITKRNYMTPGREEDGDVKLFTRADVEARKKGDSAGSGDAISAMIAEGLGGKNNLSDLDCCATRLRVTVRDAQKVSESLLRQSGASGVIIKGNGVQIIYGPQVSVIKSHLVDYLDTINEPDPEVIDENKEHQELVMSP
ncbi:MAG: PTS transporter subunit EIIC, partial [Selenomonadales bacterium]|nr:PTS transporter subunit EIIC [Selenomonadales bacterium]